MAGLEFVNIKENDFGGGIDQQSVENKIPAGFVENAENVDFKSTGSITKRTGYQGYSGFLPVRVQSLVYNDNLTNNIILTLDDSIVLGAGHSVPLILKGKTSKYNNLANVGDFPTDVTAVKYYTDYSADSHISFLTGTHTLTTLGTIHGIASPYIFTGISESNSQINNNNTVITPDNITVNLSSYDIDLTYTNNTGSAFNGFIYFKNKSAVGGETYVSTGNTVTTGTNLFTITSGTHSLNTNNIIVKCYKDTGTVLEQIQPTNVYLNSLTGQVQIELENNTGASYNGVFILTNVAFAQSSTGSVAPGTTQSIVIDTSVDGGSDFAFISCYLEPTIGGILEQVLPDSIVTDSTAQTITVTFTNYMAVGANFNLFWDFANYATNLLTLSGTVIDTADIFVDASPQLNIYGLNHSEIYGDKTAGEGWVSYIDSYRAEGENRLISGLGGNLFAARTQDETELLIPTLYPRLASRVASDTIIAPCFYDTGETPNRTRGFITGDNGGTNEFNVTDILYNSGTGYVDYYLQVTNIAVNGTLSDIISTTTGLEDRLTISQAGYAVHNGVFKIKNAVTGVDSLILSVINSNIDSADYNETDSGASAGIFTDFLQLTDTAIFRTDDTLSSDIFTSEDLITVVSSSADIILIDNIISMLSIPGGLRITGSRSNSIIPLRTDTGISSVENLVIGDNLSYTGISRELTILSINQLDNINLTITSDGTTATAVLGTGNTNSLYPGKTIEISESFNYSGNHVITATPDSSSFQFSSDLTVNDTAVLTGKTIEIDEQLTFTDTTSNTSFFTVPLRWDSIEKPEDNFNLTPATVVSYLPSGNYTAQPILRSAMAQDSLFLTNKQDSVLKFDGTSVYRAGLFRWQPHLFVTTDTTASGKIVTDNPTETYDSVSGSKFIFTTAAENTLSFKIGQDIKDSQDGETYTITGIETVSDNAGALTKGIISVDRTISGAAGTKAITVVSYYKYYFRLNMVDINNNIIASAAAGADDFAVALSSNAAVNLKLVGMPALDLYDYDRLEVQIYRTKKNQPAPFYRLTTLPLSFNSNDGYLLYTDTDSDDTIKDLDEVNTALKGQELGTAWSEPLRAEHITSFGNKTVLANIKDYPELDIRFLKINNTLTQSTFLNSNNKLWQFKKDNTDLVNGTDMINRARYEFTNSAGIVTGITGVAGTSFSVTSAAHGLSVGSWVYLYHPAVVNTNNLTYAGLYQVSSITSVNIFVIKDINSVAGAASNFPTRMAKATVTTDIPVYIGTDGNYSMLNGNRTSSEPYEFLAARRLANIINASMRKVDTSIAAFSHFAPWMVANAGNEYNVGQIIIRQPKIFVTSLELTLPALSGDFNVFVNNIKRSGTSQISALVKLFPSRVLVSYPNFPEIFDNPFSLTDAESDSAIDVNVADGQNITGVIPFFGQSAFGAALNSGIIIVFKTNSIYAIDLANKAAGTNPVQKLETAGKGCTSPRSIALTKNGIMFANETGVYKLNKNLEIEYVGRKYERKWKTEADLNYLSEFTANTNILDNCYKLSYYTPGETEPSTVAVYAHDREYEQSSGGLGSWTTYTNHPAVGWANLPSDSFFASTAGNVFKIRKTGELNDYRDNAAPVESFVLLRALDVGDASRRKSFSNIVSHFRTAAVPMLGTEITTSVDLNTVTETTDPLKIKGPQPINGVSDTGYNKITSITSSITDKNGVYFQIKYSNSLIDENLELSGVDIRVAGRAIEGVLQAASTTTG